MVTLIRVCTNTHNQGQEGSQAVKAEELSGKRVKDTCKLQTVKGQALTGYHICRPSSKHDTTCHWKNISHGSNDNLSGGQGPKNFLTTVTNVCTESIGVTSPCYINSAFKAHYPTCTGEPLQKWNSSHSHSFPVHNDSACWFANGNCGALTYKVASSKVNLLNDYTDR